MKGDLHLFGMGPPYVVIGSRVPTYWLVFGLIHKIFNGCELIIERQKQHLVPGKHYDAPRNYRYHPQKTKGGIPILDAVMLIAVHNGFLMGKSRFGVVNPTSLAPAD